MNNKTRSNPAETYESIKLGIDAHAKWYYVARQLDGATPQPVQKMTFEGLLHFVARQQRLAGRVYTCYEAGAFGYHLHRHLTEMGVTNYVVQPQDWDERGKGVKNDRLDALALCQRLDRFTRGNRKAFSIVRVPTEEEERERAFTRQRQQIVRARQRLQAMGRSLLASHGIHVTGKWWKGKTWGGIESEAPEWVIGQLKVYVRLIEPMETEEKIMTAAIHEAGREAEAEIPRGVGPLTFEVLRREVGDSISKASSHIAGGALFHSDRGCLYTSGEIRTQIASLGMLQSMSAKGNCYDNATCESFFARLKAEAFPDHGRFDSMQHARLTIFEYIEAFYNRTRRHSSLGNIPPEQFLQQHSQNQNQQLN